MFKRIFSLVLVLSLLFCIAFECSLHSAAIAGVDDVIILGVCLDLLAMGITIYSVSDFCQSNNFRDFCMDIGRGAELFAQDTFRYVKRNGRLFIATAAHAWNMMTDWVKSKFSGRNETKQVEFETTESTTPSTITLNNGTVVPWADFMQNPFLIYVLPNGDTFAWYCSGENPGVNPLTSYLRLWCTGTGKCYKFVLENGAWSSPTEYSMRYGLTYKGVTGSFFDVNRPSGVSGYMYNMIQFRTIEKVNDSGSIQEEAPPNTVPEVDESTTAYVTASSDSLYYPGAVEAPVEVIQEGEEILVAVPDALVVDADTNNPTVTTDRALIGDTLEELTPTDVKPKVLTESAIQSGTVEEIIADTPAQAIPGDSVADIDTANKFRLPRSFLEGFPFSIPYSIYVGIQSFLAEPQAPAFSLPFSISRLGISEKVDIDLTNFTPLARLCRALLSLVWVAGLAMACNKFIKR